MTIGPELMLAVSPKRDRSSALSAKKLFTAACGCYVTEDNEQHISEGCQVEIHDAWSRVVGDKSQEE